MLDAENEKLSHHDALFKTLVIEKEGRILLAQVSRLR